MSEVAGITLGPDDTIVVSGDLSVDTVADYREDGIRLMQDLDTVVFDLAACEIKGSAGVALLIAWQRAAANAEKSLVYRNATEKLLAIARACGVEKIVPFA